MGFEGGVADTFIRYHDREQKYEMIVHAEINAILNAVQSVAGCTLYTWPLKTCARCAAAVIQAGITDVVVPLPGRRCTTNGWNPGTSPNGCTKRLESVSGRWSSMNESTPKPNSSNLWHPLMPARWKP